MNETISLGLFSTLMFVLALLAAKRLVYLHKFVYTVSYE